MAAIPGLVRTYSFRTVIALLIFLHCDKLLTASPKSTLRRALCLIRGGVILLVLMNSLSIVRWTYIMFRIVYKPEFGNELYRNPRYAVP